MSIHRFIREEQFFHHYQPIYNLSTFTNLGYEVLLRSNVYSNPEQVFLAAKAENQLYELDSRSIHKAIMTYSNAGFHKKDEFLFINVLPSTISHPNFSSFISKIMDENDINSQRVVWEISESELIEDYETFNLSIAELKKKKFLFAIDDIGKGYSNFQTIIELEPDFLKLDRYFSKNLHLYPNKQKVISFFLTYCRANKSHLILEGIENKLEMNLAKALGVSNAQGYFIGKPNLLKESI